MELINGEYYLTVDETCPFICITDYVYSNDVYDIECSPSLKITASSIYLENGENIIKIKQNEQEFILHFYKEYRVSLSFLDENNHKLYQEEVIVNKKLNYDDFKSKITINEGFIWDGTVIYYDMEVSINDLLAVSDLELIVVLKPLDYTITFTANNDLFPSQTKNIKTGEVIEFDAPEVMGYLFDGLYIDDKLIETGTKYEPTMGDTFICKYSKQKYELTYNYDGMTKTVDIFYQDKIEEFIPFKIGYTFLGWKLNGEIFDKDSYDFSENINLVGEFIPNTYELSFDNDGVISKQNILYNEEIELSIPNKDGYKFMGWYLDNELFTETSYLFDKNITLVAKWEKINVEQKVNVNLETFGGLADNNCTINSNDIIELPIPQKEGFSFIGWYYDVNYQFEVAELSYQNYHNELLYAKYKHNSEEYIESFVLSSYNEHVSTYDVLTMFDNTQSGFASKYWHKLGIKLIGDGYYITAIAKNGEALSTLGEYDFVILAYADYDLYSNFVNMNVDLGYRVIFSTNPEELSKGSVSVLVTFVYEEVDYSAYYKEIGDHLSSTYSKYTEITSSIELIDVYNDIPITWVSSNNEVISSTGIFRAPRNDQKVTLTAYVNKEKVYEFVVNVKGTGDTKALATGYIYTPYSTITQNAMNTLDIIYCAFLDFNKNGDFTNLTKMKNNINNYIKPKALKSGTKIVISINQGESGAFSSVASSAELREKLATNTLAFIQDLEIDGVDVDWEVPSSSEIENFTLLMKVLYEKVKQANPEYLVTAAIGGGKWQPPKYDLTNSRKYLDYVNLMTYSMATGNGYYQNALFKSTKGATLTSCTIEESIKIFNDYGILNSQILVGIPFYLTVQTESGGPGSKTGTGKSIWYSQLDTTYKLSDTMKEYFDEECGVPYRYDAVNKIFISYENEKSIKRKCEYINSIGLAGIMYWQYGQDVNDMLSDAIAKYINGE